jgi:BlaR1 peptidase M56/Domain of unknown function (DUF3471)
MLDLLLESSLRSLALGVAVWLGLALLRVRNPRAQMTAWTVVLIASLAMPALMHRLTVTIPAAVPPLHLVESLSSTFSGPLSEEVEISALPPQDLLGVPHVAEPGAVQPPHAVPPNPADRRRFGWSGFDWRALSAAIYILVAGVMLLRLLAGLLLSVRMVRAARPIHEGWAAGADVRVSDDVATPVTFGSTVLLPGEYTDWSEAKRLAVLSHERAHVAHGDFHVLLLAALNRAVFWFNPLAWWQLFRIAELAEIISDDAALEMLDDRPSYAGILLDLAGSIDEPPVAIAMARACTLCKRVERILAETALPARMGWRKRAMVAIVLAPGVIFSAGAVVPGWSKQSPESVGAGPPSAPASLADTAAGETHPFDRYLGYYEFDPFRAVTVARAGDRLTVQETGRPKFEVAAHGDQAFVSEDTDETASFASDDEGHTTALLLGGPGMKARRASRIDSGRAQSIENAFARQYATAPDRFKDQLPAEGSKSALLKAIQDLQVSAPDDERIGQMADSVRGRFAVLHTMLAALGPVESVFFRGVGPGGYDIYGAKLARGLAEFRVRLAPQGNIEDIIFRPDGDSTPGEILTCAQEQTLKAAQGTVPIQLLLYNDSGADIRAVALDGDGSRSRDLLVGDERSAPFLAHIGQPWVVTDASGQCLEIIMPGQRTRFLTIPADAREQAARPVPQRRSPVPGSEQALREYIDALARGTPKYDDMTPQVAAYTRQQLLLNRAVLARLGTLRAMSFRAVTANGNDLYIAHFTNGSAEWRIGLVKQDKIGRIALGPQY